MVKVLNLAVSSVFFLCLDQPMVINTIERIIVIGCSTASNLSSLFAITDAASSFNALYQGDIKYQAKPINNWMWETIKVKM